MTLITTAGDPNADSYAAVADADAYFANLGNLLWTATDTWKEIHLRRATRYLDNQYRARWRGVKSWMTQSLAWPRGDGTRNIYYQTVVYPLLDIDGLILPINTIPIPIQQACMEAAFLSLSGVAMEPHVALADQNIVNERSQVDVLAKQVQYAGTKAIQDRFLVIEGLLRGLVTSVPGAPAGTVQLVRA